MANKKTIGRVVWVEKDARVFFEEYLINKNAPIPEGWFNFKPIHKDKINAKNK